MAKKQILIIAVIAIIAIIIFYYTRRLRVPPNKPFNKNALGYKQNNPGNIRRNDNQNWDGEVQSTNGFEAFSSMTYGYRALAKLIYNQITINHLKNIRELITVLSPPAENNTANYIQFVAASAGISSEKELSQRDFVSAFGEPVIKRIVRAISEKEIGGYDNNALSAGYTMLLKEKFSL